MSDSTSHLDLITSTQPGKEVTANALLNAASPTMLFALRSKVALTWAYYGGPLLVDGVYTLIANGSVALTASTTNFIEATRAGVVSANTTGFTAGRLELYTAVTDAANIVSHVDRRTWVQPTHVSGRLALAMTDANTPLTAAQARNDILELTGTLTVQRNIVLPLGAKQWIVFNNTAGGFGLQFIGATGTGIVVAATKRAILYADGTNVVRVTADT